MNDSAMAELAALSFANDVLIDPQGYRRPEKASSAEDSRGRFHKVHGRRRFRPPRPPDKPVQSPARNLASGSGGNVTTGTRPSGPFRSSAPPIVAFGDAVFSSSMRGSAPTPNRKVSSNGVCMSARHVDLMQVLFNPVSKSPQWIHRFSA